MSIPDEQPLPIAVRAYVCKADQKPKLPIKKTGRRKRPVPSEWVLVFDTETTTDAAQKLRFGTYQVRKCSDLMETGVFYDPETLNEAEQVTLKDYAAKHELTIMTVQEFIEDIFYRVGYKYRASIVGFNLPFDISRLAIDHAPARGTRHNKIMRGGFTFKLSKNHWQPRVQIKHVSSRDAFIQFAATREQRTSRGNRKKGNYQAVRRGFFIDTKTLAAALTSQSHTLASLARDLGVEAQKHHTDDHGRDLTPDYIEYAMQDTQTTWECFERLQSLYELHGLELTAAHSIHSEASLGKAYLKDMGVKPWRKMQPDFPDNIIGNIMSAYYGGRSEIHIRKTPERVRPFNFLLAFQGNLENQHIKPVAPFHKDPLIAAQNCFDRETSKRLDQSQLKTYLDSLAQYHLHPETKFLNGDYIDVGTTQRRHIRVKSIQHIGKEANKWEEQFFTGFNPDAQIEYGMCAEQKTEIIEAVLQAIKRYGISPMAQISKLSQRHILNFKKEKTDLSENALQKLYSAAKALENRDGKENELRELIRNIIKKNNISIRQLAENIETDPSNLSKLISGSVACSCLFCVFIGIASAALMLYAAHIKKV